MADPAGRRSVSNWLCIFAVVDIAVDDDSLKFLRYLVLNLKPANFTVDATGRVMLLDFGRANGGPRRAESPPGSALATDAPGAGGLILSLGSYQDPTGLFTLMVPQGWIGIVADRYLDAGGVLTKQMDLGPEMQYRGVAYTQAGVAMHAEVLAQRTGPYLIIVEMQGPEDAMHAAKEEIATSLTSMQLNPAVNAPEPGIKEPTVMVLIRSGPIIQRAGSRRGISVLDGARKKRLCIGDVVSGCCLAD